MARHRDIRNMDFRDDYDGYDDVYGHSVDDDYCISPSNRQYLYNRESSTRSSESDIKEEDELEAQLSDLERARLESCIDQIKSTIETLSLSRNRLVNIIISHNFNIEKCINAILEESSGKPDIREKDLTKKIVIPKLNGIKNIHSPKTNFIIPKLFDKNSQDEQKKPHFIIPTFGKPMTLPNLGSSPSNKEFKSLSEVVSNHLDSQIIILNEEVKKTTLEDETNSCIPDVETITDDLIKQIEKIHINQDQPLPCNFDSSNLLKIEFKLKKSRTRFAHVLCRKYKRSVVKLSINSSVVPKKIKLFDFSTPSPDDCIRQHLKK